MYYVYRGKTLLYSVPSLQQAIELIHVFYGYDEAPTRPHELKAYKFKNDRIHITNYQK